MTLEPRLFELLHTLSASGLDWLAQEVLQGARAGHVAEEPAEAIQAARQDVFREFQDSGFEAMAPAATEATPFSGDEQLDWAVAFVSRRLGDALAMMSASIDRLDLIVNSPSRKMRACAPGRRPFCCSIPMRSRDTQGATKSKPR